MVKHSKVFEDKVQKLGSDMNQRLDDKVVSSIEGVIKLAEEISVYTVEQLDDKVNEDETLREYLIDGADEFKIPHVDLDSLSTDELNARVSMFDHLWAVELS